MTTHTSIIAQGTSRLNVADLHLLLQQLLQEEQLHTLILGLIYQEITNQQIVLI